jgi:hypothetical protein
VTTDQIIHLKRVFEAGTGLHPTHCLVSSDDYDALAAKCVGDGPVLIAGIRIVEADLGPLMVYAPK